jgi:ABC-type transport system involved in cytochrome bd biosynthesis fused ATPase/permease subunit
MVLLAYGSVVYLIGLALWHERAGYALRLAGWILAVSALAIPSTLTLLLPVVCVLALTIRSSALALPDRL